MRTHIRLIQIICILLSGLLLNVTVTAQVTMPTGLVANDDAMFIVVGNEVKGSYHVYNSLTALADLENLSANRMQKGMLVTIIDADAVTAGDQTKTFMLAGTAGAWEWKEVSLSFVEGTLQSDTVLCDAVVLNGDTIIDIAQFGDVVTDSTNTVTSVDYVHNTIRSSEADIVSYVDSSFNADTLVVVDGDTVVNIIQIGETVTDSANSLPSVGYVHGALANGAEEIEFDGNRNITRDITVGNSSLKGQNLNAANMAAFLEAVFFPKSAPTIDSLKYLGDEAPVIAYADWSTWLPKPDVQLDWQITNVSKEIDGLTGPEYDISSIVLKGDDTGADVDASPATSSANIVTGTVGAQIDASGRLGDSEWTKELTLLATDAQGSIGTKNIKFTFSPAVEHVLGTPSVSGGYYLERTGATINYTINIPVTINDEKISDISINSSSVAVPGAFAATPNYSEQSAGFSASIAHADAVVDANSQIYAAKETIVVSTQGDVYAATQTDNSQAVYLVDRAYAGYVPDASTVTEGVFKALSTTQLNLNPFGMQTTTDGGVTLNNTAGNNYYLVFVIPSYGDETKSYKIETFDLNNWYLDSGSGSYLVDANNGFATKYYIVYASNPYSLDKDVRARIIEQ